MKTTSTNPETFESTYALLLRSEEKQRSRFETLIYTIIAVSTIVAVLQFGREAALRAFEHRACVDDRNCPRATRCLISGS